MNLPRAHAPVQSLSSPEPIVDLLSEEQRSVVAYYGRKTASILRKYGPGPRIHFHLGCFSGTPSVDVGQDELQRRMVEAQEALMDRAAECWNAPRDFGGRLLDVGCGLGGGSIYWALRCDTDVTAVTIAAEHLPLIRHFAEQAGVSERVHPVHSEASAFEAPVRFDAVVAIESSCYFDRPRWFSSLSRLVRPGGVVCIEDGFLCSSEWRLPSDRYWRIRIGTVAEYAQAARAAGFELVDDVDLTDEVSDFWRHSIAWTQHELLVTQDDEERRRLQLSIELHGQFHRAWREHGVETRLVRFRHAG